ncbi:hypothetical protein NPIL_53691 [Nephila pilipes]|uniref:Uncharacterized protein n=1 Tax=Nephila pilipes TaxID=299642 RepID=A0A8X6TXE9_NEPPI|nr:hypothetical protein NPIL_53691 [Nephila pilipes]
METVYNALSPPAVDCDGFATWMRSIGKNEYFHHPSFYSHLFGLDDVFLFPFVWECTRFLYTLQRKIWDKSSKEFLEMNRTLFSLRIIIIKSFKHKRQGGKKRKTTSWKSPFWKYDMKQHPASTAGQGRIVAASSIIRVQP